MKNNIYDKIIYEGNAYAENHINSQYMALVKEICYRCSSENKSEKSNRLFCEAYCAHGNYIATLKFLWNFIRQMTCHIEGNDITEELEKAIDKVKRMFPDSELYKGDCKTENSFYKDLFEVTKAAVEDNYLPIKLDLEHTEAGRCKYILLGIIIHLICEVMFSRAVISKTAIESLNSNFNNALFDESKHFKTSDFADFERKSDMIRDIINGKVCFNNLKKYRRADYTQNHNLISDEKEVKILNDNYVYNPNFYPQRVEEAVFSVAAFLSGYTDGFDPYVLKPLEMQLDNFETYLSEIKEKDK